MPQRLMLAIATGVASVLGMQIAQAQVNPPEPFFQATQTCAATPSVGGANPGNVTLTRGKTYVAIGLNRQNGSHVLLKIPDTTPPRRWVKLDCGQFQAQNPDQPPDSPPSTDLPKVFFDNINNPVAVENATEKRDITPPPPPEEPFDTRVLAMCGEKFDLVDPQPQQFKQLLRDYPDVREKIQAAVGGELTALNSSPEAFLSDLTKIWFHAETQGFKHIFCGEADSKPDKQIGGLHFHRRYWQLQQSNQAEMIAQTSRGTDSDWEVVPGVIYTFGVKIRSGDRTLEHCIKGYPYTLNAQELLLHATKAYKQFSANGANIYSVSDRGTEPFPTDSVTFPAVFVKQQNSILTFYPDATPDKKTACDN